MNNLPNPILPEPTKSVDEPIQFKILNPLEILGWDSHKMLNVEPLDPYHYFKFQIFNRLYYTLQRKNPNFYICFECKQISVKHDNDPGHACAIKPIYKCLNCFENLGCHICNIGCVYSEQSIHPLKE